MNKQQFKDLEIKLEKAGYKRDISRFNNADYYYWKSFHKQDNQWEEGRPGLQVILYVYDYTEHSEFWDRLPKSMRDCIGIEPHLEVSRTIEERMDLITNWDDDTTIEEIEKLGEDYYKWVCEEIPEPKKRSYEED